MGITKKRKAVAGKVDDKKVYSLSEASGLVKQVNTTKFDSSVDLHIRLGVDPKASAAGNQGRGRQGPGAGP